MPTNIDDYSGLKACSNLVHWNVLDIERKPERSESNSNRFQNEIIMNWDSELWIWQSAVSESWIQE